jgi:hypothetical protein
MKQHIILASVNPSELAVGMDNASREQYELDRFVAAPGAQGIFLYAVMSREVPEGEGVR